MAVSWENKNKAKNKQKDLRNIKEEKSVGPNG